MTSLTPTNQPRYLAPPTGIGDDGVCRPKLQDEAVSICYDETHPYSEVWDAPDPGSTDAE